MQIRRALQPAVEELEGIGFIESAPVASRYQKQGRGKWQVTFIRETGKQTAQTVKHKATKRGRISEASAPVADPDRARVAEYLSSLTESERENLEQQAFASADAFLLSQLDKDPKGLLGAECRRLIIQRHVISLIGPHRAARRSSAEGDVTNGRPRSVVGELGKSLEPLLSHVSALK